jgi:hypothetical protein
VVRIEDRERRKEKAIFGNFVFRIPTCGQKKPTFA